MSQFKKSVIARSANVVGARKSDLGGVRVRVRPSGIIIGYLRRGNRGVDMRSVYCVFEHLIFMDLKRSPKCPSYNRIRL